MRVGNLRVLRAEPRFARLLAANLITVTGTFGSTPSPCSACRGAVIGAGLPLVVNTSGSGSGSGHRHHSIHQRRSPVPSRSHRTYPVRLNGWRHPS
jgi:hypothetical protein